MFHGMSFYLVLHNDKEDLGERVPSTSFTSLHLSLPSFLHIRRSDKAGRPGGCTALPNEADLGTRGKLIKDNDALRGPLKRSAEGNAIFVLQFCSGLIGSRRLKCSGYQRPVSSCTEEGDKTEFPNFIIVCFAQILLKPVYIKNIFCPGGLTQLPRTGI